MRLDLIYINNNISTEKSMRFSYPEKRRYKYGNYCLRRSRDQWRRLTQNWCMCVQIITGQKQDTGRDIYYLIQLRKKPITSVKKHKANYSAKCAKCYNVGHLI